MNASLVKITARLLDIEYVEIDVTATVKPAGGAPAADKKASKEKKEGGKDDQKPPENPLLAKSITGKFPVLETPEGFTIFEATSIAKYFARQRRGFYGSNDFESMYCCISMTCI